MPLRHLRQLPPWPSLLVLAFLLLTLNLGFWQLRRAELKRQIEAAQAAAASQPPISLAAALQLPDPAGRRVVVEGYWLMHPRIVLDNQSANGRRGEHELRWLQLDEGQQLLVDRGWQAGSDSTKPVAANPVATELANGRRQLLGYLHRPSQPWRAPVLELAAEEIHLPVLDLAVLAQGRNALPWLLRLDATSPDALQPNWHSSGMTVAKHHGYAVTWFSLSAVLVLMYVWWLSRQPSPEPVEPT